MDTQVEPLVCFTVLPQGGAVLEVGEQRVVLTAQQLRWLTAALANVGKAGA